jgi:hypothetical protein
VLCRRIDDAASAARRSLLIFGADGEILRNRAARNTSPRAIGHDAPSRRGTNGAAAETNGAVASNARYFTV